MVILMAVGFDRQLQLQLNINGVATSHEVLRFYRNSLQLRHLPIR